jgi:hypothetical protein
VPEGTEWLCPRHFCTKCGSNTPQYTCRFCPTSFCNVSSARALLACLLAPCAHHFFCNKLQQEHLPSEATLVSAATGDIGHMQYIHCQRCTDFYEKAGNRGMFQ